MLFDNAAGLPPLSTRGFVASPPDLPDFSPSPDLSGLRSTPQFRSTHFTLNCGTANVASLSAGPDGHAGKVDYLRAQFQEHGLHLLGIQESRCVACSTHVDGTFRLSSGSQQGHFGVELWVNTKIPFGRDDHTSHRFGPHHFVVVHSDPRAMIIRMDHPALQSWILVAHAPQSGRTVTERETWWTTLSDLVTEHCAGESIIVLIDANASSGPCDHQHVFSHDGPSPNTPFLRDFLAHHGLCLPSTSSIHRGSSTTWSSPDGLITKRIDYVSVPCEWLPACSSSQVVHSFDLGNCFDHHLVQLDLKWSAHAAVPQTALITPGLSRTKLLDSALAPHLSAVAVPSWESDIGTHVDSHNAALLQLLTHHCGQSRTAPKKPYIDAECWSLRTTKLQLKKRVHRIGRQMNHEALASCFQAWKKRDASEPPLGSSPYFVSLCIAKLHWVSALHCVSLRLRLRLKRSKLETLRTVLSDLPGHAPASAILQKIKGYQGSTNLAKLKCNALPLVHNSDGRPCVSAQETLDRWIDFFMNMEGGARMGPLEQFQQWRDHLHDLQATSFHEQLTAMPSLTDLEIALRRVSLNKATGPDGLPGELCHGQAHVLARQLYSQLLKLTCHGQEALIHKGGRLTMLFKGKGSQRECSSYRSILVSSHLGKCLHRVLRSHQQSMYESFLHPQQLGGRKHLPVTVGLHMLRGYLRSMSAAKRSTGVLFLDLREAFYRVVRPFAVNTTMSDEAIAAMVARLHLPPEVVHELHTLFQEPNAIQRAGLPWYMQKYVSALHVDTHFALAHQSDACVTNIGSRPGDCFADVVFGYVFARMLHALQADLQSRDLLDQVPHCDDFRPFYSEEDMVGTEVSSFLGPVWMDDLAIGISANTGAGLVQKMGQVASLLLEFCLKFGMTPNTSRGKTEILFTFIGAGSRRLRLQYHSPANGQQFPVLCEHGLEHITVVQEYVHLGNLVHMSGKGTREMRRRIALGQQAFNGHRRLLFQNTSLSLARRCQLFDTLVMSKVLFGTEIWILDQTQEVYFHRAVLRLYRRILKLPADAHWTDEDILEAVGLPSPALLLRRQRLRYLACLFSCGPHAPWGILHSDTRWMALLHEDLDWMHQQLATTSRLTPPRENFGIWRHILSSHRGYWKKLVNRAVRHACRQQANTNMVLGFHRRLYGALADFAELSSSPSAPASETSQGVFGCMCCQKFCRSKAGEGAHMFRTHGQVAAVRYLFDSTSCPNCLKEFHSHARVQHHLWHSTTCVTQLRARGLHCAPAPGAGSLLNSQQEFSQTGALPVQAAAGPLSCPQAARAQWDVHWPSWDAIGQVWLDHADTSDAEILEALRLCVLSQTVSWTQLCLTVQTWLQEFGPNETDICQRAFEDVKDIMDQLIMPELWPFLQQNTGAPSAVRLASLKLAHFEHWCLECSARGSPWNEEPHIPRLFGRVRIVLHAYSGRRRPGDVQYYLDQTFANQDDFIILTVSLDLIVDKVWGDISRWETRTYWLSAAQSGYVIGFLGGPPCNTWSRARGKSLPSEHLSHGPRIVRTEDHLWGLPCLSLREMESVFMGNLLLIFALEMLIRLYISGGCGLLEHPAEPDDEGAASIWKLPVFQLLLSLDGFRRERFLQGLMGAPSPKATEFLLLRLDHMLHVLHKWRVVFEPPKSGTIGHDGQSFRTAQLKEYPPALCGAIAQSFALAFTRLEVCVSQEIPAEFLHRCQEMVCTDFGQTIGLDFAGWTPEFSCYRPRRKTQGALRKKKKKYTIYAVYVHMCQCRSVQTNQKFSMKEPVKHRKNVSSLPHVLGHLQPLPPELFGEILKNCTMSLSNVALQPCCLY